MLSRPESSNDVLLQSRSDLRLCCAICAADAGTARQLLQSRKEGIDWPALIEVAKNHRLEMLLYRAATSHFAEAVPATALQVLRSRYAENRARGLALTSALLRLLARFTAE